MTMPTDEEIQAEIAEFDRDNNGELDFKEFSLMFAKEQADASELSEEEKLRIAFNGFDTDGNGSIDKEEFMAIMTVFGSEGFDLTTAEGKVAFSKRCDDEFAAADRDGSGGIDFDEFLAVMTSTEG